MFAMCSPCNSKLALKIFSVLNACRIRDTSYYRNEYEMIRYGHVFDRDFQLLTTKRGKVWEYAQRLSNF